MKKNIIIEFIQKLKIYESLVEYKKILSEIVSSPDADSSDDEKTKAKWLKENCLERNEESINLVKTELKQMSKKLFKNKSLKEEILKRIGDEDYLKEIFE